jgi:RNA polymerase sigma factor (TIGR02999 family)
LAMGEVTRIFEVLPGDPTDAAELMPLLYEELRKLAAQKLAGEPVGQTLQPTALVHDAWLRMTTGHPQKWQNRAHFFAAAAEAMRRILIDNSRRRNAQKRGAGVEPIDLDGLNLATEADDTTLLMVNEALELLAQQDAPAAKVVELRFFLGLSNEEAAQCLGISERTVKRQWAFARAWLYDQLGRQGVRPAG